MKRILLILLLISSCQSKQTGYQTETLLTDLDTPWALDFLPDNSLVFTQRPGIIMHFKDGVLTEIGKPNSIETSESGLLGIAVDPQYNQNHYIYVYYTYQTGEELKNRVSRFTFAETLKDETVILDNIPGQRNHDGGRIKFGPDGKLYIGTGDALESPLSQDIHSLAGKILRINSDGSIPNDNPFGNEVWSYGHRNVQGLAWKNGQLYASEHGQSSNDEINIIDRGKNYGWPDVECTATRNDVINPIRCFSEFTLAPSGMDFLNDDLYIAGLRGTQIRKIGTTEEELFSDLGRVREVVTNNNKLYVFTNNRDGRGIPRPNDDKLLVITYLK